MKKIKKMNIAIDGPAGAGKSTVAKMVATELDYIYIDTGAMYRALTLKALELGIDFNNDELLCQFLEKHSIRLMNINNLQKVFVDSQDVTKKIRSPEVTSSVSIVAAQENVRLKMADLQRELAKANCVVMDGRDIGTNVLPDADLKIFLTASIEVRAKRRYEELISSGYQADLCKLMNEIALRDKKDQERTIAPLKMADEALLIDTSFLSISEVVNKIMLLVKAKKGDDRNTL